MSPSDTPVTSPLARAPRFSPPTSRTVSPRRRPLHERSNSQTNQSLPPPSPTIRLVDNSANDVYDKIPFPSQSSQILPPRKVPGYGFEQRQRSRQGSRVSDTVASIEARAQSQVSEPPPLKIKKARQSTATTSSDADTLVASSFSPKSERFSQTSTFRSTPSPDLLLLKSEKDFEVLPPHPSSPLRTTIRAVSASTAPSTSSSADASSQDHALTPRASAASLASTDSEDEESVTQLDNTNYELHSSNNSSESESVTQLDNTNYELHSSNNSSDSLSTPRHKYTYSSESNKQKQASPNSRPISTVSSHSFANSDYSYATQRPRSASQPAPTIHEAQTATVASGVQVNYPAVRAPSASSLRASSQDQLPTIASRMNNRDDNVHHWSSQLSTIASESERESRSIERVSNQFSARSQSHDYYPGDGRTVIPRRRQTVGSVASSDNVSSNVSDSSVPVPLPLFSPVIAPSHHDKESEEGNDTVSPLQSPPLRMKTSFMRRRDSDSRSPNSSRPSSAQSDFSTFVANTIPLWARAYYRRGEHTSLGAPESMTDASSIARMPTGYSTRSETPSGNFPLSIYRPRNRPRHQQRMSRASNADTMTMSEGPLEQGENVYAIPSRRHMSGTFTPRLRQDRRSTARLSAWKAPSFDENFGSMLFSRQNRQTLLFCLGFLLPPIWMIAAVLPLPPNPEEVQEIEAETASELDQQQRFDHQFGPVVDKSYQKAHWWRNLNRIMSGVGTLLIGAIIALAILASRMSS